MAGTVVGPIGTLGNIASFTKSGRVFSDLDNLICLVGSMGQTTNWATLRKVNDTSGYEVPVGKSFIAWAYIFIGNTNAGPIYYAYGDNDVGFASASAPTTTVYPGGSVTAGIIGQTITATETIEGNLGIFSVPTGKYPAFSGNGGAGGTAGNIFIFGYEV